MVGGATNQHPQDSQLAPPLLTSSAAATTEEEEFLKRNTDCVYFLASPLTCKKGSECEYRHNDIARLNPRDCWYWLNGNCLNPKCAFRHPPLDGLLEAEVPTPMGPAVPQAPVKQGVACIFFQQGFCLKGHLCPFWHGQPKIVNNFTVHPMPPNHVTKPSKVASAGPDISIQEQKFTQQENAQKSTEFAPQGKQVPRVQQRTGGAGGGIVIEKKVAPPCEDLPRYKPANVAPPPVVVESPPNRSNHDIHEANHFSDNDGVNGKDADEYSREPTPGFDVLVDNEHEDSEYYPNEEQFGGRSRGHEFDIGRSVDYDVDHDMYCDQRDFDHYNKEGYAWEDHRENSNFGRKRYARDESPDQFDPTDLRYRLSKQRRNNNNNNVSGLKSVISREHSRDSHTDRMPRRDVHYDRHLGSGLLSSRLRGRIRIPGSYGNGSRVEREIDTGRQQRSRYSPERTRHVSSNHSRFRDRIKARSNDDFNNDGRDYRSYRRNDSEFAQGKERYQRTESQQSEDNLSFEGPKPLSEILKRKRRSVISSGNHEDDANNQQEIKEIPSVNLVNADNEKSTDGHASLNHEVKDAENDGDATLDQELEAYDHRNGDYDYEQMDGEEYNLEEGEEYLEEGDETGKKEIEVFS